LTAKNIATRGHIVAGKITSYRRDHSSATTATLAAALVALALASLGALASVASARGTAVAPSARIRGVPANPAAAVRGSGRTSIPLRVIDPSSYAAAKRRARRRAEAHTVAAGGGSAAGAQVLRAPLPRAVLLESLDTPGLAGNEEFTPPDTTGAIGPADYVEFVNSEVAAFSRSTLAIVGAAHDLSTFVGGVQVCDPQIKYDPQSSRWFYVALRCDGTPTANALYLGFSKTSDPTDFSIEPGHGWCGYEYNTGEALEDYPKLGLDSQHIIVGTNSFHGTSFVSAHVFAGPKPVGAIGACPTEAPELKMFGAPLETSVGDHAFTPEPATVADGSLAGYVVSADVDGEHVMIWQVGGTAAKPELEELGAPKVPFFEVAPSVPQPGTSDELDTLDPRFTQAVAAADPNAGGAEAVWTQHTVEGGAGSVVRWYEIVPSKLEVRQQGTISDPSKYVFNGAIAPTRSGGAVINYDTGSSSALVQLMAQSRIGSAPLGTMNTPLELASSTAADEDFSCPSEPSQPPCRWGDYAGASVDPNNANAVWGSNQINGPSGLGAQWRTQNFAIEPNDIAPTAAFSTSVSPGVAGSPVGFNGAGSSDEDGSIASYSWNFGDSSSGSGANPSHTYAAAGFYTVTLTVTDNGGQTAEVTHSLTVEAPPPTVTTTSTTTTGSTATTRPSAVVAGFNANTGAITFALSLAEPGTLSWLGTFQNGKFGVFTAHAAKCRRGRVRLGGRCLSARIVFARGSKTVVGAGRLTVVLRPNAAAAKALKNAFKHRTGVPVSLTITFQSARGGSAAVNTRTVVVKLKRR
jgi:PKD domain-containing protein